MLSYISGAGVLLSGGRIFRYFADSILPGGLASLVPLAMLGGFVLGGLGVANERNAGYVAATATAGFATLATLTVLLSERHFNLLLSLAFDVVLLVLLLHPQSREYRKIWFR